jgi:hypothetical protein
MAGKARQGVEVESTIARMAGRPGRKLSRARLDQTAMAGRFLPAIALLLSWRLV